MKNGDGWLKLCPAYRDPPVHPPTSDSAAFPFAPLVDFLKSKQSTSSQPIPFSDILAHLISAVGYPDLFSLYNSVPGVTTFGQYLDAAVTSGVVSLVSGTTSSRNALVSLRDTTATLGVGPQLLVPINPTISQHGPFEPLVSNLTKLWREGKQEPMLCEIHPLILAQDIMAYGRVGAMTIKDYVMKAAAVNLVIYDPLVHPGVSFMASTVRLREPPLQLPDNPLPPSQPNVSATPLPSLPPLQEITVSPPSVTVTASSFRDLVAVLTKLRASTGESESRFSGVVPLLLKRQPNAYASVGVAKFKDYVILAMETGVVRIREMKQGDGWVSLSDSRPGDFIAVPTELRASTGQHPPVNMEGVSEGEEPQVGGKANETHHPKGDQPSEGLGTVVEPEDELAIPMIPDSFDIDYLLERPGEQLKSGVNMVRNADNSSQSSLSRDNTCIRDDDPPFMVHLVPDSSNLVDLGAPACKRLITRTFSPQEVTSLIEAIFVSEDEVKMVRDLRGDDAQTFIDVIHEVRSVLFFPRHSLIACLLPLLRFRTFAFRRSGSGSPGSPTMASEDMPRCLMPDLWSSGFASEITANPTLLQSIRYPAVSRRVR